MSAPCFVYEDAMERLDKFISSMGLASRKDVKKMIRNGEISVDNTVCRDPGEKYEEGQMLNFGGEVMPLKIRFYYMMNKPQGYLSATQDRDDKTVIDLLSLRLRAQGLFPAGRLDRDSCGLLILTNDGDFAHKIMSPHHRVDKLYFVRYEGRLLPETEEMFRSGMTIDGDEKCLPAKIEITDGSTAFVTVQEGKYHQVKRMIRKCNASVVYLKRISIGPLRLDESLEEGEVRELTDHEIAAFFGE